MKRICYTRPDGGVDVVIPIVKPGETEDAAIERVKAKAVPSDATGVTVVDEADIPHRDSLRNAWRQRGKKVVVDMDEGRKVKIGQIRRERDRRLQELDGPELYERSKGDETRLNTILAKKQALRDLPETVEAAIKDETDPARLDAYEPSWPD